MSNVMLTLFAVLSTTVIVAVVTFVSGFNLFFSTVTVHQNTNFPSIVQSYCKEGNLIFLVEYKDMSRSWVKAESVIPCEVKK